MVTTMIEIRTYNIKYGNIKMDNNNDDNCNNNDDNSNNNDLE